MLRFSGKKGKKKRGDRGQVWSSLLLIEGLTISENGLNMPDRASAWQSLYHSTWMFTKKYSLS